MSGKSVQVAMPKGYLPKVACLEALGKEKRREEGVWNGGVGPEVSPNRKTV